MRRRTFLWVLMLCLLMVRPIGIKETIGEVKHDDYVQVVRERNFLRDENRSLKSRIQSLEKDKTALADKAKEAKKKQDVAEAFAKSSPAGQAQQIQEAQAKQIASLQQQVRELQSILDQLRRGKDQRYEAASKPTSAPTMPTSKPTTMPHN